VPTARYRIVSSAEEGVSVLNTGEFGDSQAPVVIKADGLAAGKGVFVATNRAEAVNA
jgi:phosphoribosylamine--glycine ligase